MSEMGVKNSQTPPHGASNVTIEAAGSTNQTVVRSALAVAALLISLVATISVLLLPGSGLPFGLWLLRVNIWIGDASKVSLFVGFGALKVCMYDKRNAAKEPDCLSSTEFASKSNGMVDDFGIFAGSVLPICAGILSICAALMLVQLVLVGWKGHLIMHVRKSAKAQVGPGATVPILADSDPSVKKLVAYATSKKYKYGILTMFLVPLLLFVLGCIILMASGKSAETRDVLMRYEGGIGTGAFVVAGMWVCWIALCYFIAVPTAMAMWREWRGKRPSAKGAV